MLELSGVSVTAYGLALGVAFAVGIGLAMRRAPAAGVDPDVVLEAGLVAMVSALLGSRLLFALESPESFQPPRGEWLDLVRPRPIGGAQGLSMSLGVLLAVAAVLGWLRVRRQPILRAADVMAPSVLLGSAITRVGCFLNGCCHGVACAWPWGVRFPEGSIAWRALGDVPVHPTQLYTAAVSLAIFAGLVRLAARAPRPGTVFFAFLALWSGARLALDQLRFYPDSVLLAPGVATHQPIVAGLCLAGLAGLAWLHRPPRKGPAQG